MKAIINNCIQIIGDKFDGGDGGGGTLQEAYNASNDGRIVTDAVRAALKIRQGSGDDTDHVFSIENGSGDETFYVDGQGNVHIPADAILKYNGVNMLFGNTAIYNYFFAGAGNQTMTGDGNIGLGVEALELNTSGNSNIAVGSFSMRRNTEGIWNTAFGTWALQKNTKGNFNLAFGGSALNEITEGENNIGFGIQSGQFLADGTTANSMSNNCLFFGNFTRASVASVVNEIVIGDNAIGSGSNSVTIGNNDIVKTVIKGNPESQGAYDEIINEAPNLHVSADGKIKRSSHSQSGLKKLRRVDTGAFETPIPTQKGLITSTSGDGTTLILTSDEHGLSIGNSVFVIIDGEIDELAVVTAVTTTTFSILSSVIGMHTGGWVDTNEYYDNDNRYTIKAGYVRYFKDDEQLSPTSEPYVFINGTTNLACTEFGGVINYQTSQKIGVQSRFGTSTVQMQMYVTSVKKKAITLYRTTTISKFVGFVYYDKDSDLAW